MTSFNSSENKVPKDIKVKSPNKEVSNKESSNTCVIEQEEVDKEELKRDRMVEQNIVSPVTAPIEEKSNVEKEVHDKFAAIGVKVLKISGHIEEESTSHVLSQFNH